MNLIVTRDYEQLSAAAADTVVEHIRQQPDSVLVMPTGNTRLGMYRHLVQRANNGAASFRQAHLVELDEYLGIELDDPRNLYRWLDEVLITPAGFSPVRTFRFDSTTVDRRTKIDTGWGKDDVTIRDSIFGRKVIFEGGLRESFRLLLHQAIRFRTERACGRVLPRGIQR